MKLQQLIEQVSANIKNGQKLIEQLNLLEEYNENDWEQYVDFNETYTRKSIYTDDYIEILILGWEKNSESGVHDHPDGGCLFKLLKGNVTEVVYKRKEDNTLQFISEKKLGLNSISYKESKTILHSIINGDERSVCMLVYSPANYVPNFYEK